MATSSTTYAYKVRDQRGKLVEGRVEAPNESAVAEKLMSMGYAPLEVRLANSGLQREISFGRPKRIRLKDLAVFSRQFSTMINAGLTMLRALTILSEQVDNVELRKVLRAVKQDVEAGSSLSGAMGRHTAFPPIMVNLARAGEAGGFLDRALNQVAENFEKEVKLRAKIKSAMTYPVVVFVMAIVMCAAMMVFVVPTFEGIFTSLGGQLPFPTRILLAVADAMKYVVPAVVVAIVAAVAWWRRYNRSERVRNVWDPLKLRMPVFGGLVQKLALARFARNLGTLLGSGVPILQSLDVVADTTGSIVVTHALADVRDSVRRGESLAGPLAEHPIFPTMVQQMIASGEESGAIDEMLHKVADFYDSEVEATTEQLSAMVEPLMIAFLGVVVGSMLVALYLPIFNVGNLL
ncbi:MAG TPA: type II secretion system F family protein [Nocardioides sp.]|uniref:type II secretion system F family protein n=1 Tax=Nocardioides sp. TaxID=35761 RepID=UPI002BC6E9C7|nr:type II secretion system F family protein [Nocardioides sp.]HTW16820.1 type II secretion system F family protein [Nocardioides sp.]